MTTTPDKSLSERVIDAVIARLEQVRTANNFRTDAGIRVFYARRTIAETDLPCFIVWDGGETATNGAGAGPMSVRMDVIVEAHCKAGQGDTGAALQMMKADAKRAVLIYPGGIGAEDPLTGRVGNDGAGKLDYTTAATDARRDGNSTESIAMTFSATITEGYGNPYGKQHTE